MLYLYTVHSTFLLLSKRRIRCYSCEVISVSWRIRLSVILVCLLELTATSMCLVKQAVNFHLVTMILRNSAKKDCYLCYLQQKCSNQWGWPHILVVPTHLTNAISLLLAQPLKYSNHPTNFHCLHTLFKL